MRHSLITLALLLLPCHAAPALADPAGNAGWRLFSTPQRTASSNTAPTHVVPPMGHGEVPARQCREAIRSVERESGLPPMLLAAMARVESGRRQADSGAIHPWPWTVNAEGEGHVFPTKAEAVAYVRQAQARGLTSMDVGCLQVNLMHHPAAFSSLETAFDPMANARYAARYLLSLNASLGDWARAAGAYHSRTPDLAAAYRARVLAAWPEEIRQAAEEALGRPRETISSATTLPPPPTGDFSRATSPAKTHSQASTPGTRPLAAAPQPNQGIAPGGGISNGYERSQLLAPAEGTRGRGLQAYRMTPIPTTSRPSVSQAVR